VGLEAQARVPEPVIFLSNFLKKKREYADNTLPSMAEVSSVNPDSSHHYGGQNIEPIVFLPKKSIISPHFNQKTPYKHP
jgi:hypothetical protein